MNTTDKIAIVALMISIIAAIFSVFFFLRTDSLSRNAFNRNYRPYVVASSYAYIRENVQIPEMNVVQIKIFNAPAFIVSKKLKFYIRSNNTDTLLFEHPDYNNELLYPTENTLNSISTAPEIINDSLSKSIFPKQLIRKIRIEYQWISDSALKY